MNKLLTKIKKKLNDGRGETLTETLGSLLIIVPAMIMLAGALVTASKINYEVRHSENLKLPTLSAGEDVASTNGNSITSDVLRAGETVDITYNWKKEGAYYYFK